MIVWAAQTRVHYMFCYRADDGNSFVHSLAALHKEVERDFRTAIRAALDDSRQRPRLPRVGLTGICNIASALPPFNMSLQKRKGIAGLLTTLKDTSHEEEVPLADR